MFSVWVLNMLYNISAVITNWITPDLLRDIIIFCFVSFFFMLPLATAYIFAMDSVCPDNRKETIIHFISTGYVIFIILDSLLLLVWNIMNM